MKRILIITRNFPPLVGGMERLVFNIYKQLAKHYVCDVIGPPGSGASVQDNHQSYACRLHPAPIFILSAAFKCLWASSSRKHEICIAGSGLTIPVAVIVSTIRGLESITFIHGLDLIIRSRIYQSIFIPFIRRSDIVVANSRNTARLAEQAGIPTERILILHPGVDMPDESQTIEGFGKRYNLEGKSLLLSAGRLIKYLDDPDVMPSPASCRAFAERFNWDRFGDRLRHIINLTPAETSLETE